MPARPTSRWLVAAGISAGIATGADRPDRHPTGDRHRRRWSPRPVCYLLSRIPVDGSYLGDLLPGMFVDGARHRRGLRGGTTTAANAGVPPSLAGLAAALVNSSQQIGGALGLAIFTAIATSSTNHLLATGHSVADAMTQGFHRALLAASVFLLAAAVVALRTRITSGEYPEEAITGAARVPEMS